MVNYPYTPSLHPQRRINHQAETTVRMMLTKNNHSQGLLDIGTEMACFAWNKIPGANFHHCSSDWNDLLAHETTAN